MSSQLIGVGVEVRAGVKVVEGVGVELEAAVAVTVTEAVVVEVARRGSGL
jgi:molybdenum cofactor biosynthesis enzyme